MEVKKTPAGERAGHADAIHTSTVPRKPRLVSSLLALVGNHEIVETRSDG